MHRSFVVLGAEPPWIYPLAVELAKFGPTAAVSLGAGMPWTRRQVVWPFPDAAGPLQREVWTYPPGFNRTFAKAFDLAVRTRLRRLCRTLQERSGAEPYVIVPYPPFFRYVRDVAPAHLVYWNYDDHSAARGGTTTGASDDAALARCAGTILCSSGYQTARFRQAVPARGADVFHFPHGVHESFVNRSASEPADPNTVCSVGVLGGRYDWSLIHDVVAALPNVEFRFVGELDSATFSDMAPNWQERRRAALAFSNVRHVAGLKHRETAAWYWRSAANWMPYDTKLEFVQACCPLKLTDGLASGRPVVSAEVPECRRYPEWISTYRDAGEAVSCVEAAIGASADSVRAERQTSFAVANSWAARAKSLIEILQRGPNRRGVVPV